MVVDGAAATALAELVRMRWLEAACRPALPLGPTGDPWPEGVPPDFTDVEIGIARTIPAMSGRPEVGEIKALYCRAIAGAERFVYIENQYLTADCVAEALARRMTENRQLEVIVVGPERSIEQDPAYGAKVTFKVDSALAGWNAPTLQPWLVESMQTASKQAFGRDVMYLGTGGSIPFIGLLAASPGPGRRGPGSGDGSHLVREHAADRGNQRPDDPPGQRTPLRRTRLARVRHRDPGGDRRLGRRLPRRVRRVLHRPPSHLTITSRV